MGDTSPSTVEDQAPPKDELHGAVIRDQNNVPSLVSDGGEIIVGTRAELRAAFGGLVVTTARLPDDTEPVLSIRKWMSPDELDLIVQRLDDKTEGTPWPPAPLVAGFEPELVEHARRELALLGENDEWFVESIVAAMRGFLGCGHSGGSAPIAIDYLTRLLSREALTSLTNDPAEWVDRSEMSGYPLWQNARDSRAMSEDGGKTYWMVDQVPEGETSASATRYVSAEPVTGGV
jgi:hypothetical protein